MRTLLVNPAMRVTLRIALPYSLAALPARPPCRLAAGDGRTGMARLRLPIGGDKRDASPGVASSSPAAGQPVRRAAPPDERPAGQTTPRPSRPDGRRTDGPAAEHAAHRPRW